MFKKTLRENKPRNLKKDIRNMNFFFLLSPLTDPGGFFVFFLSYKPTFSENCAAYIGFN